MRVLFLGAEPGPNHLAGRVYRWLSTQPVTLSAPITAKLDTVDGWELGVSCGYVHRVPGPILAGLPIVNLHTGYLPWNRGRFPNVWPILDGSPAGVTLHWMDAGIDTGPILAQARVTVEPWDTAGSLYRKLEDAGFTLFQDNWLAVMNRSPGVPQRGPGTTYRKEDLELVRVSPETRLPVRRVLDILRARSFPGYGLTVTEEDGRCWEVSVSCRPLDGASR
jgi:methionyl-tRNA formyltransferase